TASASFAAHAAALLCNAPFLRAGRAACAFSPYADRFHSASGSPSRRAEERESSERRGCPSMRCLLFVLLLVAPPAPVPEVTVPTHTGETAWLCHSRIGGCVPLIGRLHHTSVAICPCGELPAIPGAKGAVSNPRCAFVGTQPKHVTFLPEDEQRVGVVSV